MKAMILAAGRGERMRPLTDSMPKPLLQVGGKPLIAYHIQALAMAGVKDIVINTGWLGEQIEAVLSEGSQDAVSIEYSREPPDAYETGGGILHALPLLGEQPFIVVNADIWTDYDFSRLPVEPAGLAHLILVDNPPHHLHGDFMLDGTLARADGESCLTFSGIGVYRKELFADCVAEKFPLAPLLRAAMQHDQVTAEHYRGQWSDVGTPEQLAQLDSQLSDA